MSRASLNHYVLIFIASLLGSCVVYVNGTIGDEFRGKFSVKKVKHIGTTRYRHGSMIGRLWFATNERLVSAGGQKFRLFDAESGELKSEVAHPLYSRATFDGDRRVLVAEPHVNGVPTQGFYVVDIDSGKQMARWTHPEWVVTSTLSRRAKFAVLGNLAHTISIVDTRTGREIDRIDKLAERSKVAGYPNVALTNDARTLAVIARRNHFRFYELTAEGRIANRLATIDDKRFFGMVFSPNNDEVLLVGHRSSSMFNIRTGKEIIQWDEPGPNRVSAAVFASMGRRVAELADGIVRVRDVQSGKELRNFPLNANPRCDRLALSPDETVLAAGGFEGRVRLYDFATGKEIRFQADRETHGPVESVAISDDGQWIASADYKGVVSLWNGANDWKRIVLRDDDIKSKFVYDTSAGPNFLTFLPGEARLLAGSGIHHNSVNVWDVAAGKRVQRLVGHASPIIGVATSRDGRLFASHGRGGVTWIWARDGEQLHQIKAHSRALTMSPDGQLVAIATRPRNQLRRRPDPGPLDALNVVGLWNAKSGKRVLTTSEGTKASYGFHSVSFSPDGKYVAAVARDGLYVWQTATGELTRLIPVSKPANESEWHAPNCGCAFSPTENIVAVPRSDGAIVFLDIAAEDDPQIAIATGHTGPVHSVSWRRDGKYLVSGGSHSTVVLWQIDNKPAK